MKRVLKGLEPQSLANYRAANPSATWEDMRDDAFNNGRQAALDCRTKALDDQKSLCAYCEQIIDARFPHKCRVEHFHPKSYSSPGCNWHLDWQNMLATCNGGESEIAKGTTLTDNLSCDAHKNYFMSQRSRQKAVEGNLINPLDIPAFPNVFILEKSTGHLVPDSLACVEAGVCESRLSLTIDALNLNCARLARKRTIIVIAIEKRKKELRDKHTVSTMMSIMVKQYLEEKFPGFFTTYRCCLGEAAEIYLKSVGYQG
jgi:uncharacterized protein (TIGR02646 family)